MNAFTVYPAIDLRAGKVVRLRQGDPAQAVQYSDDPAETARRWLAAGARWLHVVNLDGAFGEDDARNRVALLDILRAAREHQARVQFGGGLRDLDAIAATLSLGVDRVIVGTMALEAPEVFKRALSEFGSDRLAAGVDVRGGEVQVRGWRKSSHTAPEAVAEQLHALGVRAVIVTDIARDGMGSGLNIQLCTELGRSGELAVIASGGVHSTDDIRLARNAGLAGVIVGRALYEGAVRLEDALQEDANAGAPNHSLP